MNKRIANRLTYDWWKYLSVALIIVLIWVFVGNLMTKVDDNEKVGITFVGEQFNDLQFEKDLNVTLPTLTEQKLREIKCESIYGDSYQTQSIVNTRLLGGTDIFIFTESYLSGIPEIFKEIDKEVYSEIFGDITFFELNSKAYGIKIENKIARFFNYYSGEEQCYIFISGNSVNCGGINGKGNVKDDAAVQTIKFLLEKI